jgi:hypothetical protein
MTIALTSFVYRNRAGGVRDIASRTHDNVIRRLLLEMAADYDQIAEMLERITATEALIGKRTGEAKTASHVS